ncbi:ceramide kinase [Phlebotomus argentipes]|uniref:ceramide kinase n=1 Tax=Phlebotomus argentipes TaxID=94469 RepID=UPI002892A67F|nr:ceramide kinase [Phlebotomus argentipes]
MEEHEHVLLAAFHVQSKRVRALLHAGFMAWEPVNRPQKRQQVSLLDVVAVTQRDTTFTLHHATQQTSVWRVSRTTFSATEPGVVATWTIEISRQLNSHTHRPRRLLLFINPFGGRRTALKVYERHVRPLLELAGVRTEIIVTQRPHEIKETIEERPLQAFDSVACVGGDGTFAELFNGLVARECRERNIAISSITLPRPQLPAAIIPAGSTNTVAFCLHGTDDPVTSALHLILGLRSDLDLCSVSCGDETRLYASVLSYGYLGDIARESERLRWMGPRRYDYSGLRKFFRNRGYRGEVSVLPDISDPTAETPKCFDECDRCASVEHDGATTWHVIRGKFFMVSGANISCACRRSPAGMSPTCHLGDGCVDVIVVQHTNILNNLRLLLRLSSRHGGVSDLPFVRVVRARAFHFRTAGADDIASGSTQPIACDERVSVWNCDGEVLLQRDAFVRTHRQLLTVFRRPLSPPDTTIGCTICKS